MVNAQEWLDKKYPKNSFFWKKRKEIKELNIFNYKLEEELDLSDFEKLEELNCFNNNLTILNISNCPNLTKLNCSDNDLVDLDTSKNEKLVELFCSGNISLNSLDVTKNVNLVSLHCVDCPLDFLDISKNLKLESLGCDLLENDKKMEITINGIRENIFIGDFQIGSFSSDSGIRTEENVLEEGSKSKSTVIVPEIPVWSITRKDWSEPKPSSWFGTWFLGWVYGKLPKDQCLITSLMEFRRFSQSQKDRKREHSYLGHEKTSYVNESVEENYANKEITYDKIYPESSFLIKINKEKPLLPEKELPIKLYNIKTDQVEWTKDNPNIKNYAILSYVWGRLGTVERSAFWDTQYKDKLNPAGYKSLCKAVQVCKNLGINYLWMDQLCIDQTSIQEKNQEVPKMRQYYSNADVTLVAIHTDAIRGNELINGKIPNLLSIVEKITKSEWFKRSWTFQEGWLSKQTLFMFDDKLIDGRILAGIWVLKQSPYYNNLGEFVTGSRKFATPLGWTCHKEDYRVEDEISLSINQALQTIRERDRTLSIDGIYSVLGLLPYGSQVKPKYKEWGHKYTKEEVREALLDVMKIAIKEGYSDPLTWQGKGDGWMPEIIDEKGSTSVKRGLNAKCEPESIILKSDNIEVVGSKCIVESVVDDWFPRVNIPASVYDPSFIYVKTFNVKLTSNNGKNIQKKITLLLDYERDGSDYRPIPSVEKGDVLFVLDKENWKSEIPFALLLLKKDSQTFCRKGLVGLHEESKELLSGAKKEKVKILKTVQQAGQEIAQQQSLQIQPAYGTLGSSNTNK